MMRLARLWICLVALAGSAHAAPAGFESDLFHPSDTAGGYFATDGAFVVRHLGFTAGLFGSWAHAPLVLRDALGHIPDGGRVIDEQVGFDLTGSFGLFNRLEIAFDLPFVVYQATDNRLAQVSGGLDSAGLGDLRLDAKVLLYALDLHAGQRIGVSLIAGIRAPTGDQTSFLSQGGVTGYPRLVAEWRAPHASLAFNLGAVLRQTRFYGDLAVTHQIAYAVAGRVGLVAGIDLLAELDGLAGVGLPAGGLHANEAPLEAEFGLRYTTSFGASLSLAGGAGLTRGYGTPDGRVLLGFRFQSPEREAPKPAAAPMPVVPVVPVAYDEPRPLPPVKHDADGDGVIDRLDECPNEPGPALNRGCPDRDADGDGVVDRLDRCPHEKGDTANGGCPLPDHDHDGVADAFDRCPEVPGSSANDGCPDIDSDGDGLVNRLDKCPFDAEVYNGVEDADGCPDPGRELARYKDGRVVLLDALRFVGDSVDNRSLGAISAAARLLELYRPKSALVRVDAPGESDKEAFRHATVVRRLLIRVFDVGAAHFAPAAADGNRGAGQGRPKHLELVFVPR